MKLYDISEPISPATAVFPGDTPYSAQWVMRMEQGASCNVSTLRMSAHCGTHTDAPLHFDPAGKDMATVDLAAYLGPCRVVQVAGAGDPPVIPVHTLAALSWTGVPRVLFKTAVPHDHTKFREDFTALGPAAAQFLAGVNMRLVGIDTPSMDPASCKQLLAHQVLHKAGVAILENLDLSAVPEGDYELIALPLRIVGGDSSPVRAILRQVTDG